MTAGQEYFMIIAEEKSISKAAERLYMSPQNLNNYVGRLEHEYGTLFVRRPKFELTPKGAALYEMLQKLQVLEKGLKSRFDEIDSAEFVTLKAGIHATRARAFLPYVLSSFHRQYPNVSIEFVYKNIDECAKMLLAGDLDLMLGIDETPVSDLEYIGLFREPIFLVVSEQLLHEHRIPVPEGPVIPQEAMAQLSYLLFAPETHLVQKISQFFKRRNIPLNCRYTISDFELQLILASQNLGACFVPQMMLQKMHELNRDNTGNPLLCYYAEGFQSEYEVSLVLNREGHRSAALQCLVDILKAEIPRHYAQRAYLPANQAVARPLSGNP